MTYTYNPAQIKTNPKDRLRFELGDIDTSQENDTALLCDEEYHALLEGKTAHQNSKLKWLNLKLEVVDAIIFRLSYQVNIRVDTLEYDLASRVQHMQTLRNTLAEEIDELEAKQPSKIYRPNKQPPPPYGFYQGLHSIHPPHHGRNHQKRW